MDGGELRPPDGPNPGEDPWDGGDPATQEQEEPQPTAAAAAASGDGAGPASPGPGDGSDALARAIASVLGGVMTEFDAKAEAAARSQDVLALSLDRLTGELDKLLEDAPLPFIMQHAAKITGIRKRVFALNSVLKSIQRRIDHIDMMLSAGLSQEKAASESTGQPEI
uniref:Biogenesis of lysosome-related organelles complex 1 subunit 7 n=1 Tax=Anthurium amnicola TaxID=1678845 RepID=A0A1D1Z488_9ARAE